MSLVLPFASGRPQLPWHACGGRAPEGAAGPPLSPTPGGAPGSRLTSVFAPLAALLGASSAAARSGRRGRAAARRARGGEQGRAPSFDGEWRRTWINKVEDPLKPDSLRGNWTPRTIECHNLRAEVLEGDIPADLPAGHFVQNGPNPRWVRPSAGYHPFEGDGMIHSVEFGQAGASSARYSNSWVRTAKWHAEEVAQCPLASGFLDDNPVKALVHATVNVASWAFALPMLAMDWDAILGAGSGFANTSVVKHAGRVLALQDGTDPIEMEMKSLATKGPLAGHSHFTSHPKVCPKTGELIWYDYSNPAGLNYGVWDRLGRPIHQTVVPMPRNVMVHDIAVTERYTIIPDCPLLLLPDFAEGHGPVHLWKDVPMRIGVLPRHGVGEEVDWYEVRGPGKCCFHMMNAHETDSGDIVVVGCAMPDFSFWDMNVAHAHKQELTEWRIDRKTRQVTERVVSNVPCDFPEINGDYLGQPFRYGYSAAFDPANREGRSLQFSGIAKHDVKTSETFLWEGGEGVLVSEPVFVPRASAGPLANIFGRAEDDGYILTFARDERRKSSEVLIFDAKDFGGPPICRLQLPRRVPHGFHCSWIPADEDP